ncbi:hypothetical protein HBH98_110310 [Parastagonospora nodorum]|nr:hypothetical protein HBH52_063210 [Parastagonospora nodorum]KAH3985691.1 hypothetical protein HBH51_021980 [Parastagonospora nodorum]KAH4037745.1 hypothetical protein HBI09_058400 [Parastagonospora nodorum]KAH4054049.1 hypothetical protein HBH49_075190 [Parastagonospora nodorum]KAH4065651.1 hypothetical protein HBH50_159430 [Parastagonospora nodorum]
MRDGRFKAPIAYNPDSAVLVRKATFMLNNIIAGCLVVVRRSAAEKIFMAKCLWLTPKVDDAADYLQGSPMDAMIGRG